MLIFIGIFAFTATFLGGLFALKFKDKLHLILGFSAGAVIGVAFFELIPEAIELGQGNFDTSVIMSISALGFVIYMILDRFVMFHSHHNDHDEHHKMVTNSRGKVGAGSLSIHSFMDGIAIGLAFQVSTTLGIIIAIAVLVHDFSDGINTVSLILKNNGSKKQALKWLFMDSIAPVLGIISTLFFSLPSSFLAIFLAVFSGFFLYIGASDLLPESHHNHPTVWTTIATVLGVAIIFFAIKLAGI